MAFISVRPTTPPRGRAINQYLGRCRQRRTATVSTNGFSLLRGWWKRARNSRIRSLYKLAPYFDASTRVGGSQRKVDGGLADGYTSPRYGILSTEEVFVLGGIIANGRYSVYE